MTPEELEAIASRKTTCHPFGETVTLSRAERDQLVGMAKRYAWLTSLKCNSFTLSRDDDHACNYMTAAEWISTHPEDFEDDSQQEIEKMKSSNTIWRLQVYPNSPVGFWALNGATLDAPIDAAMAAEIGARKEE